MPYKDPDKDRAYHTAYKNRWRKENPERAKAISDNGAEGRRRWREANPERVAAAQARANAKYRDKDIDAYRARDRMRQKCRTYGITETEYHEMVVAQAGRCAICGDEFTTTPHVDHCHESGQVRGLLCRCCNAGIAMLKHDSRVLHEALSYLEARAQ